MLIAITNFQTTGLSSSGYSDRTGLTDDDPGPLFNTVRQLLRTGYRIHRFSGCGYASRQPEVLNQSQTP